MPKKLFKELQEIDEIVGSLYQKDPKLRDSKFGYWYNKFYKKNYQPVINEMAEKLADVRIDNAMVDEKTKEVLYTPEKAYKFTKEGLKAVNDFNRKMIKEYEEKEIEVIPCISSEVPEGLGKEEAKLLKGLLI